MNYYPGQGLAVGTAVLGSTLGQAYPNGSVTTLCKLYGTILTPIGAPGGVASSALVPNGGSTTLVDTWRGVKVDAAISPADLIGGAIISVDRVSAETNEYGYFELFVIQGLTVTVSCASFGKTLTIDTTGLTSINLSTYF